MWESRVLCEISKRRWKSFWDFRGRGISIAVPSSDSSAVPRRCESARHAIDAAEFDLHEAHKPIATVGLDEPDQFALHRGADKNPFALPRDLPRVFDAPHLVGRVVPGVLEQHGIRPRRRHIVPRRRRLAERFVRTHGIEFPPHPIKPPLLLPHRGRRRRRGLLLQGEMESLVPSVLLRMPPINPIQLNLSHHTASWVKWPAPVAANGEPLSVRIALGKPYSRNARSNQGRTPRSLGTTMRQQKTNRLHASAIVNGSHRV